MSPTLAVVGRDQWCGDVEEVILFHINMNRIYDFAPDSGDRREEWVSNS